MLYLFTVLGCKECVAARLLLRNAGLEVTEVMVDDTEKRELLQAHSDSNTNVPLLFDDSVLIGRRLQIAEAIATGALARYKRDGVMGTEADDDGDRHAGESCEANGDAHSPCAGEEAESAEDRRISAKRIRRRTGSNIIFKEHSSQEVERSPSSSKKRKKSGSREEPVRKLQRGGTPPARDDADERGVAGGNTVGSGTLQVDKDHVAGERSKSQPSVDGAHVSPSPSPSSLSKVDRSFSDPSVSLEGVADAVVQAPERLPRRRRVKSAPKVPAIEKAISELRASADTASKGMDEGVVECVGGDDGVLEWVCFEIVRRSPARPRLVHARAVESFEALSIRGNDLLSFVTSLPARHNMDPRHICALLCDNGFLVSHEAVNDAYPADMHSLHRVPSYRASKFEDDSTLYYVLSRLHPLALNLTRVQSKSGFRSPLQISKALVRMVRRFHEDAAEQAFVVNGAVLEKDILRWERDVYPDDFHTDPNSQVFKSALANAALELQNANVSALTPREHTAFFLNVYRVLLFHAVLEHGFPSTQEDRERVFDKSCYVIDHMLFSLNDIEHGILRGNKPRPGRFVPQFMESDFRLSVSGTGEDASLIHFALVYPEYSSPCWDALDDRNVFECLQSAAAAYCSEEVQLRPERQKLILPGLFHTYATDFGENQVERLQWLARVLPLVRDVTPRPMEKKQKRSSLMRVAATLRRTGSAAPGSSSMLRRQALVAPSSNISLPMRDMFYRMRTGGNVSVSYSSSTWDWYCGRYGRGGGSVRLSSMLHGATAAVASAQKSKCKELSLRNGMLKRISADLCKLSHLNVLDISNNPVKVLPDSFANLRQLRELNVADTLLEDLGDAFSRMTQLKVLDVSGSNIKALPPVVLQLDALEELHMARLSLSTLPDEINSLRHLRVLSVARNRIRSLPSSLAELPVLEVLNAAENQVVVFPDVPRSTEHLFLAGNAIECIPVIGHLNLVTLSLARNCLTALPADFRKLRRLAYLDVADNPIGCLCDVLSSVSSLDYVRLGALRGSDIPRDICKSSHLVLEFVRARRGEVSADGALESWGEHHPPGECESSERDVPTPEGMETMVDSTLDDKTVEERDGKAKKLTAIAPLPPRPSAGTYRVANSRSGEAREDESDDIGRMLREGGPGSAFASPRTTSDEEDDGSAVTGHVRAEASEGIAEQGEGTRSVKQVRLMETEGSSGGLESSGGSESGAADEAESDAEVDEAGKVRHILSLGAEEYRNLLVVLSESDESDVEPVLHKAVEIARDAKRVASSDSAVDRTKTTGVVAPLYSRTRAASMAKMSRTLSRGASITDLIVFGRPDLVNRDDKSKQRPPRTLSGLVLGTEMRRSTPDRRKSELVRSVQEVEREQEVRAGHVDLRIVTCERYNIDDGELSSSRGSGGGGVDDGSVMLAHSHYYYRNLFLERPHISFIRKNGNDIALAVVTANTAWDYRVLLRTVEGDQLFNVPRDGGRRVGAKELGRVMQKSIGGPPFRELRGREEEMLALEDKLTVVHHKIGVLYVKGGQTQEHEFYGNEHGSEAFEEFLSCLGEKIRLKGWEKFNGGLDTELDRMGTHSVFCNHRHGQTMFHVSTYLPFTPGREQQLERKCHLGNDIVVIMFADGDFEFNPEEIASQFNSGFILVQEIPGAKRDAQPPEPIYRMKCCTRKQMGSVGPQLPSPPHFTAREIGPFIMEKAINMEHAAWSSIGTFSNAIKRAREIYLGELLEICERDRRRKSGFFSKKKKSNKL